MERIYLDHHATTPVAPEVVAAMLPFFTERFGNAASRQHAFGQEAYDAVERARAEVSALIGADPEEIVFTSGATESCNLAIRGGARPLAPKGRHIVATAIEHPAILEPCRSLERDGFEVSRVPVEADGILDPARIQDALRADSILVAVMAANNEIGTLQPIREVAHLCRQRGIVLVCDAVQAVGRVPVSVDDWGVDLLSVSAHKMYGPKGVGALYVRRARRPKLRLAPQAEGGGQERGLRSGTLNVPGIVGLGEAARLARQALEQGEAGRLRALRDRLLEGVTRRITGVTVNGSLEARLPGNLHVSIEGVEAETVILSMAGRVAISSGAACSEAGGKGSHVLRALALSEERIYSALRLGVGRYNTQAEIDTVVESLVQAVHEARARYHPARI